jgi:hypothetical protein
MGYKDRMNETRQAAIASIVSGLATLREDYAEDRKGCNFECACIHLGATIELSDQIDARGCPPCAGKSLSEVVYSLRDMKHPYWGSFDGGNRAFARDPEVPGWHKCLDKRELNSAVDINSQMQSFRLGFSEDRGFSEEKNTTRGEIDHVDRKKKKTTPGSRTESLPVLFEPLASIIIGTKMNMVGLNLRDFLVRQVV